VIAADSHAEAATLVGDLLIGLSVPVLGPPVPETPVAGPCVLLGAPETAGAANAAGCRYAFSMALLVVSGNTLGTDLLSLADEVMEKLTAAGVKVSSSSRTYNPPSAPAGLPAYEFTLE
jgi:hypothetical protein